MVKILCFSTRLITPVFIVSKAKITISLYIKISLQRMNTFFSISVHVTCRQMLDFIKCKQMFILSGNHCNHNHSFNWCPVSTFSNFQLSVLAFMFNFLLTEPSTNVQRIDTAQSCLFFWACASKQNLSNVFLTGFVCCVCALGIILLTCCESTIV